jgi:hypothetical protein
MKGHLLIKDIVIWIKSVLKRQVTPRVLDLVSPPQRVLEYNEFNVAGRPNQAPVGNTVPQYSFDDVSCMYKWYIPLCIIKIPNHTAHNSN